MPDWTEAADQLEQAQQRLSEVDAELDIVRKAFIPLRKRWAMLRQDRASALESLRIARRDLSRE